MTPEAFGALPARIRQHEHMLPWRHALGDPQAGPEARRAYLAQLTRNLRALAERNELLEAAAELGVIALCIKGGHLLEVLYPDPALRRITDLDVVVPRHDVETLGALLEARGYRVRRYPERLALGLEHHLRYLHPGGSVVEVHWALWHELGLDGNPADLVTRARPGPGGHLFPALTDELMIALLHATTHSFDLGPGWLIDVALLLARPEVDLEAARAEAARRRGTTAFALALEVARQLHGGHLEGLPPAFEAQLPPRARLLGPLVARSLADPAGRLAVGSQTAAWLLKAALYERPLDLGRDLLTKAHVRYRERLAR